MQTLLPLLFVVAGLVPLEIPEPPPTHLQIINTEWDTHAEGFEAVMRIPVGDPEQYAQATAENSDAYRGMGPGEQAVEEWRPLVAGQFPPEQVNNALCVINSESGGNSSAKNPHSNARGLFQIMTSVWADEFGFSYEDFYIPELNTYAAARIWERSGWQPWSPRTRRLCNLG